MILFEQFDDASFASLALLMQSYAIMSCFILKRVLRLKVLVQFALFTCFVDVWYFKKTS